tara:strand:- start:71204 stop:71692 length:489 start_codon:yes stop_codon:yes gene_type:complete
MTSKREHLNVMFGEELVDQLFRVTVTPKTGKKITREFAADLHIDYENIQQELIEAPAIYAFWSTVLANQRLVVDTLKQQVIAKSAKIQQQVIDAAKTGGVKVVKYQLDGLVEADDSVVKLQMRLAVEEKRLSVLYGVIKGLEIKSNNLRSLAGFAKMEMENS